MQVAGTPVPNEKMIPILKIFMRSEKNSYIAICPVCNLVFLSRGDELCNFCNGYADEKREINQRWYVKNGRAYMKERKMGQGKGR